MLLTIIMTLLSARVILGQTTDNHNKEVEEDTNNDAINKDKVFPEDEPINSVASYSKNSLENTTKVLRGPVNHTVELTIADSCVGWPDGTSCTKRCFHLSCDPLQARCWQGHCKRYGHHPCDITRTHPCCCGDCTKDTVSIAISSILILKDFNFQTDPANANCFKEFLHIKHE